MSTDLSNLLQTLADAKVDFILVGGLAAVIHGAPTATFDVDIVPERSEENIDHLVRVLAQLHARYRGHPNRALSPDRSALLGTGHQLLMTDLGPLDILGQVEGRLGFDDLVTHSNTLDVDGRAIRVLGLEKLIEIKRALGRDKDLATIRILEATLARRRGGEE